MKSSVEVKPDGKAQVRGGKILLMGNPNVGKSVFFTELTGIHAISSNYAGTTVSYMEGRLNLGGKEFTLVDVPGTYSLQPTSDAEAVAAQFMGGGADAVVCVLDASNLARNLRLALEISQHKLPIVYALNLTDVAERHGITINADLLSQELGAPVVSTVAVKKQGFDELKAQLETVLSQGGQGVNGVLGAQQETITCQGAQSLKKASCEGCPSSASCLKYGQVAQNNGADLWATAKEIARRVVVKKTAVPNFIDRLGDNMMKPLTGIPIAILVMGLLIGVVVGGGKGLRAGLLLPLVNGAIVPFFRSFFESFIPEGVFLNILVGEFGIFVISFEWIIALVLPYVFLFYVGFSFLEDSGYLPRVSVLFDNIMNKLGVQGGSLIHIMMGYGCAVPAIIGSRAATTSKERLIISAAVCFAVPCISQLGAIISLLGGYSWWMMPAMAVFSLLLLFAVALVTGKLVKGKVDPLLIEIPNLLLPEPKNYGKKLLTRMKHFLVEAEIPMMAAVVLAALLAETGALELLAVYAEPLISRWLGLPKDAVIGLILGVIRREMSVAPLLALNLTPLQAFVGGAVSLMYLPCLSVFAILVKEFKLKVAALIAVSTFAVALIIGGLINQVGQIFV